MRELRKWAWAAVVAAAAATPAVAQQGTIVSGPGGFTTGSLTGNTTTTGVPGQLGGNTTGGGGGGNTGTALQGTVLQQMQAAPQISAPTGSARSSLDASNRFAGYYANPYFQGNTIQTNAAPGGFGIAVTTGGTSAAGLGGTGAGGARGGLNTGLGTGVGGRGVGGIGGIGGLNSATNQSGILIPVQVQMAYTAQMRFPTPPVPATKIVTDIRSVIDNTPAIANSKAVQIITDADNNVTLRGTVKSDDEAQLIEGLVRLTPGVGAITNELAFPVTSR